VTKPSNFSKLNHHYSNHTLIITMQFSILSITTILCASFCAAAPVSDSAALEERGELHRRIAITSCKQRWPGKQAKNVPADAM